MCGQVSSSLAIHFQYWWVGFDPESFFSHIPVNTLLCVKICSLGDKGWLMGGSDLSKEKTSAFLFPNGWLSVFTKKGWQINGGNGYDQSYPIQIETSQTLGQAFWLVWNHFFIGCGGFHFKWLVLKASFAYYGIFQTTLFHNLGIFVINP